MTDPQKPFPGSRMMLSVGLIVVSVAYVAWRYLGGQQSAVTTTPPVTSPQTVPVAQKPAGLYTDGSYTGDPVDAFYGIVQVKAVIQDGRIADMQFLQYPNDRDTSREISATSMPVLTQEAIRVQSAHVDIVSGATQTSEGFQKSLASALAQAK